MKKLIIGNFKMNSTVHDFSHYIDEFLPKIKQSKNTVGFALPYTHLMIASQKLVSTGVLFGAQNISSKESGSYTGEVSGIMVKDVGANFTLVGHSERRKLFRETNEQTNEKITRALSVNLKVVLCIGETKAEKVSKKTKLVLKKQLEDAFKGIYENELKNIIIAYEPVWAIGSGTTPTIKEIEANIKEIRNDITDIFSKEVADKMTILYGGSVKEDNCSTILKITGVDGLLVGGASLDYNSFASIVNN